MCAPGALFGGCSGAEASLSMLSPHWASAAHPCTRPGCQSVSCNTIGIPEQPCACVACLFRAQARGEYVPSGFSDCSAAGSAAPASPCRAKRRAAHPSMHRKEQTGRPSQAGGVEVAECPVKYSATEYGECAPLIASPYSVRGQIINNMKQNTGKGA